MKQKVQKKYAKNLNIAPKIIMALDEFNSSREQKDFLNYIIAILKIW